MRTRQKAALDKAAKEFAEEMDFIAFMQFKFDQQWERILTYAHTKNVKIIGDLPFYVAMDSADAWAHPEAFEMDKALLPKAVAGCLLSYRAAVGKSRV